MSHRDLTPDTVFRMRGPPDDDMAADIEGTPSPACEQQLYKQLIQTELARQGVRPAHLADRMRLARPRLHKILKQHSPLTETLRDQIFAELGIDPVRAKISVVLLHNGLAYAEPAVVLAAEIFKSFYLELLSCRRGAIVVDLRPAVIHEAVRRIYDLLLSHQERVLLSSETLQD